MNNKFKNPRVVAYEILCEVFINNRYSNQLLQKINGDEAINVRDRSLIYQIVYGTIKNKIYLAYVGDKLINPKKTTLKLKIIMWMSIYQAHFLDKIPSYAIVNEAVNLAKRVNPKFGGFMNAVLKNITNGDEDKFKIKVDSAEEQKLIKYSFPQFLYKMLEQQFGNRDAEKVLMDNNNIAKFTFRVNTLVTTKAEILEKYGDAYELKDSLVSANTLIAGNSSVFNSELWTTGAITFQDEMSILVAEKLAPQPGELVLDMCAAPGGKTTHLAAQMQNEGTIVACDLTAERLKMLTENVNRLHVTNVKTLKLDAVDLPNDQQYDKILLDAPCSGFGVLKRKPEIKYHQWTNDKLLKIVKVQARLLEKAYELLKPEGEMVYSTCTFNLWENQKQIDQFIHQHSDMQVLEENQYFGYENNTDGFYICRMKKVVQNIKADSEEGANHEG